VVDLLIRFFAGESLGDLPYCQGVERVAGGIVTV